MTKNLQQLLDEGVDGRHVLVRSDFNVPLDDNGNITDAGRIDASLPTLKALLDGGAKVIVMAHLGRPKGEVNPKFSLAPVAEALSERLGQFVPLAGDVSGEDAHERANGLTEGEILLLENVRFDARETSKDEAERTAFAEELAALAADNGAFVSDGFGVVHRAQASVFDVAKKLPAYAGYLVDKEVETLSSVKDNPQHPYVVVLGGSKVSDKLGVIEALAEKADKIIIGGGMCYTFLPPRATTCRSRCCRRTWWTPARSSLSASATSCCCLWTSLPARSLTRTPRRRSSAWTRSRRAGWAWTSDPKPPRTTPRPSRTPRPCSGTGRWVCSSSRTSPTAPRPSPRP